MTPSHDNGKNLAPLIAMALLAVGILVLIVLNTAGTDNSPPPVREPAPTVIIETPLPGPEATSPPFN